LIRKNTNVIFSCIFSGAIERRITDNYFGGGPGLMQQMTVESTQINSN
jgi:hypothetical protein